jgi:K+-transporting ATPase ATPase B chain
MIKKRRTMSKHIKTNKLFEPSLVKEALGQSFVKLNPRILFRNPVMFTVEIGTAVMLAVCLWILAGEKSQGSLVYNLVIFLVLFVTLLFANFAEAIAEARGKAQADSLRKTREDTPAKKVFPVGEIYVGEIKVVPSSQLKKGDVFICEAGDTIPMDGEIIEGLATIDESAITGESAPVIREAGGDKSSVTGGTKVLSDKIKVRVTTEPGESFLDKMIALVEGASRQKTPNEIALTILLAGFTIIFIIVCVTLKPFGDYASTPITIAAFISLFVCLIPTTIGGLLSAIGIAGMDRALRANVITKSGKAVETAGDLDTLLLDKTGTITIGNRKATHFWPAPGVDEKTFIEACVLASLADETPEGKSIIELAGLNPQAFQTKSARFVAFTAETRCSGVDLPEGSGVGGGQPVTGGDELPGTSGNEQLGTGGVEQPVMGGNGQPVMGGNGQPVMGGNATVLQQGVYIRKGAFDAIRSLVARAGNNFPQATELKVKEIASNGGTPLAVSQNGKVLGVIELQDIIKPGIQERFERLRKMGVKTVMVTGDNPLTAKYIAEKAGVDDFIAEAKPEDKMNYIRKEQQGGKLVAMMGDGTNDAPALAQADVGVAMNSGTQAAKEAGNMVDLDNDPTKLIEIVEIGKQLLMTRGTLTTFSIANDVAKYFAIVPALFIASIPGLQALNIMRLHSPESAILSAVIFNAIIIPLLIPLALRGIAYKPIGASALLRRNLLIYGLGGVVVPFIGIKLLDMIVSIWF